MVMHFPVFSVWGPLPGSCNPCEAGANIVSHSMGGSNSTGVDAMVAGPCECTCRDQNVMYRGCTLGTLKVPGWTVI